MGFEGAIACLPLYLRGFGLSVKSLFLGAISGIVQNQEQFNVDGR
ncbi:hypothetical protein VB713_07820 [Anabaena cylindrica UHCC 0172]|nr:hypothetical protein [Anabaena cylindrica UHCC 0172]